MAYIGWLALRTAKEAWDGFRRGGADALRPAPGRGWRLVGRGVVMSLSNPLTMLFFLAFLPGFTRADAPFSPAAQTLLLGTLFCAIVPFIYVPAILAADRMRARLLGSPRAAAWLKLASALMLAVVVAWLLVGIVRPPDAGAPAPENRTTRPGLLSCATPRPHPK